MANDVNAKIAELAEKHGESILDAGHLLKVGDIAAALREMHSWDEEQHRAEVERMRLERDEAVESRKSTWRWLESHYGKLEDWARHLLPEPWVNQFFGCIANGLYDATKDVGETYRCVAGFDVTPSGYFKAADAQLLYDQIKRAELAERQRDELRKALYDIDICLQAADYLYQLGDGPMVDRLRLIHAQVSALNQQETGRCRNGRSSSEY